jgi:DNA mismatch repair ATPase MutS
MNCLKTLKNQLQITKYVKYSLYISLLFIMDKININNNFHLPIVFNNKYKLSNNIRDDLELDTYKDKDKDKDNNSLIIDIFNPHYDISKKIIDNWNEYYTDDIDFLKQQQNIIINSNFNNIPNLDEFSTLFDDIHLNQKFLSDYHYFDHEKLYFLNNSKFFLSVFSYSNIGSPLINLAYPIFFLILPIFILKFKYKNNFSISTYIKILKDITSNHTLGHLFNFNNSNNVSTKVYIIISLMWYCYSMYNNILTCISYHKNLNTIYSTFNIIKTYIKTTLNNINKFINNSTDKDKFYDFLQELNNNKNIISNYYNNIIDIPYKLQINYTIKNIGLLLQLFYFFKTDEQLKNSLYYSIGFNTYIDNINTIQQLYSDKILSITTYTNKNKCCIKNVVYPCLDNQKSNNINFNKNYIITGPNASGKTTIIKSACLAIIFSQQFGFGYFSKCIINPYQYLHCYINIPDTGGRDSLFQAEARRCKEILDTLNTERHFCIFDELFSGTNPYEAIASAYGYLTYLQKYNINIMLTTHFIQLCKYLDKNKYYKNYHMEANYSNNTLLYSYKIKNKISNIKGGVEVLKQLQYPDIIIQKTKNIINKL